MVIVLIHRDDQTQKATWLSYIMSLHLGREFGILTNTTGIMEAHIYPRTNARVMAVSGDTLGDRYTVFVCDLVLFVLHHRTVRVSAGQCPTSRDLDCRRTDASHFLVRVLWSHFALASC